MFGKKKEAPAPDPQGCRFREQQEVNTAYQKALPRCAILLRRVRWNLKASFSSLVHAMRALITFMAIRASFIPAGCPAWST
jgi:hypothetical protein